MLLSEKVPMKRLPDEAPTQNFKPLWFQAASMFDLVSLTTARVGFNPLISADSSQMMTPLSVELLRSLLVIGCQSRELTGLRCYTKDDKWDLK